jgi:hypothetical protein
LIEQTFGQIVDGEKRTDPRTHFLIDAASIHVGQA